MRDAFASLSGAAVPFSGVSLYIGAAQALVHNTLTAITWSSEDYDTDGYHDTTIFASRITPPWAGLYLVNFKGTFGNNATGYRSLQIRKNAASAPAGGTPLVISTAAAVNGTSTYMTLSRLIHLDAGDYIEGFAIQTSGGPLNFDSAGPANGALDLTLFKADD
jgi:hypothetical protein